MYAAGFSRELLTRLWIRPLARNGNFFKNAVIQKKLQLHPKPYSYTFFAVVRLTKHTPLPPPPEKCIHMYHNVFHM